MIFSANITAQSEQLANARWGKYLIMHTYRLLGLLAEQRIKGTFFIQTEVAQLYPLLVQAIQAQGHEIAALSTTTRHLDMAGEIGFRAELRRSVRLLQGIINQPVLGFKTLAGLTTQSIEWYGKALRDVGIQYDASKPNQLKVVKTPTIQELDYGLIQNKVVYYPPLVNLRKHTYLVGLNGQQLGWLPERIIHKWLHETATLEEPIVLNVNVGDLAQEVKHPTWSNLSSLNKVKQYSTPVRLEQRLIDILKRYTAKSFQAHYFPDLMVKAKTQPAVSLLKSA